MLKPYVLFSIVCWGWVLPALAEHLPAPFEAHYEVKKGFFKVGEASRSLRKESNGTYRYESVSKTTGLAGMLLGDHITQTTQLDYVEFRPRPLHYRYTRTGRESYTVEQKYDWAANRVDVRIDSAPLSYEIPADGLDQSMYQLALMSDLSHGRRDMVYHVAENRRLKNYTLRMERSERVKTILGELDTLVISHQDEKGKRTTLWCATSHFYLPVKIEHQEGGVSFTAYLKELKGLR